MLHIPTRSDVKNEKYQREIKKDFYYQRLNGSFCWPINDSSIDYALDTYQREGLDSVDSSEVFKKIIDRVNNYQGLLVKAKEEGFINKKAVHRSSVNPNYEMFYLGSSNEAKLRKKRRSFDNGIVKVKKINKKKFKNFLCFEPVKIEYSPFELAMCELESFKHDLRRPLQRDKTSLIDLLRIDRVVKEYSDNANEVLLDDKLIKDYKSRTLNDMEHDDLSEAGTAYQWNREIARKSDIYLRFDETYWNCNGIKGVTDYNNCGIPYNQEEDLLKLKEVTSLYLKHRGKVVINGIEFFKGFKGVETDEKGLDFKDLFEEKVIDRSFESIGFSGASHIG